MTVVYVPQPPHTCDLPAGADKTGTVRRCDCGKFWVAEDRRVVLPEGRERMVMRWRPEKRRERTRREKAHRAARMAPPPSSKGPLQAPPAAPALPEIRDGALVRIQNLEGRWRVNDLVKLDEAGAWHFKMEPVPEDG